MQKIIWNISRFFVEIWYRIEIFLTWNFARKQDTSVIPTGFYCYTQDYEKNAKESDLGKYWIKPCPYYRQFRGKLEAGCTYVGFAGWDPCLGDQCKICGKNYPTYDPCTEDDADA